jgi:hypothetical protein
MAVSAVSICNQALARVGQSPIVNIDDDDRLSRICKLHYVPKRDALLREYRWKFAIARASLPASLTPPLFGFANAYVLPVDCLRVLSVGDVDPEWEPDQAYQWEREGDTIVTDLSAPLEIRYIRRVTDETRFDASFVDAFALYLAMYLVPSINELNQSLSTAMREEFEFVVARARHTSAIEGRLRRRYRVSSAWVNGRRQRGW